MIISIWTFFSLTKILRFSDCLAVFYVLNSPDFAAAIFFYINNKSHGTMDSVRTKEVCLETNTMTVFWDLNKN